METSTSSHDAAFWLPKQSNDGQVVVDALCLGTGRFLRSVLVPALVGAGMRPVLIQPRGSSFVNYMKSKENDDHSVTSSYEVDTVLPDGSIQIDNIPCYGAFSFGSESSTKAFMDYLPTLQNGISIFGVGVTEAGLTSKDTPAMQHLYLILEKIAHLIQEGKWNKPTSKLCVVNTDNVPDNGDTIKSYTYEIALSRNDNVTKDYLTNHVSFLNSMVDRITSQREGSNGLVPRCEPNPAKALVLLDPKNDLPSKLQQQPGVVVRNTPEQLQTDIALKLRVANGTHTAAAHTLALLQYFQTDILSSKDQGSLFMNYLDSLVANQIIPAATTSIATVDEAKEVWSDWRQRLIHPYFGLSTFFITQNGTAKGGIRFGPTVKDILLSTQRQLKTTTSAAMAFAYAALLRWLTPIPSLTFSNKDDTSITDIIYTGWLDGFDPTTVSMESSKTDDDPSIIEYADGLKYSTSKGWYQYKCPLQKVNNANQSLPQLLQECIGERPNKCVIAVRAYLLTSEGGNLSLADDTSTSTSPDFENLVHAIASFYSRMVMKQPENSNDKVLLTILNELNNNQVGGLIGFDTPCSAMTDYFMYLSGI